MTPQPPDRPDRSTHAPVRMVPEPKPLGRPLRWLLWLIGSISLALGLIGVVLPVMPTTPFMLVAAACYARASPKLHQRMRANRWIGPMLRDWERHHNLTRRVKTVALTMMTVTLGTSLWTLHGRPWLQAMLVLFGMLAVYVVAWWIPTRPQGDR